IPCVRHWVAISLAAMNVRVVTVVIQPQHLRLALMNVHPATTPMTIPTGRSVKVANKRANVNAVMAKVPTAASAAANVAALVPLPAPPTAGFPAAAGARVAVAAQAKPVVQA